MRGAGIPAQRLRFSFVMRVSPDRLLGGNGGIATVRERLGGVEKLAMILEATLSMLGDPFYKFKLLYLVCV